MPGWTLGQAASRGLTQQSAFYLPDPDQGAGAVFTCQPYDRFRLIGAVLELTTSSSAGDRYVTLEYSGRGPVNVLADGAAVVVTASTSAQRFVGSLRRGPAEWNTGTDVFFPLAGIWLEAGSTVTVNVAGIDGSDQLANIVLTFDHTIADQYGDDLELTTGSPDGSTAAQDG